MEEKNTDREIIRRIVSGEERAYRLLVERHQDMAYTVALRITKNADLATEITQESFINAFGRLASFRGDSKFSTWLYTIVYRNAIAQLRRQSAAPAQTHLLEFRPTTDPGPAEELEAREEREMIERAIDQLPKLEALAITLYYLREQSVKEIATVTGLSEPNVKIKLFRARKKLKKIIRQPQ